MSPSTTLRGTLADLPLDGVVHLLAANATSGVLTISPNQPVRLVWSDGALLTAGAGSPMALGRYALAAGLVTAERIEELFGLVRTRLGERQARSFDEVDVLDALASHVGADELRAAARHQCIAALTEAALLPTAHWHVDDGPPHPLADALASDAEEVLATAVDQLRHWDQASVAVGGDLGRYRRVLRLGASTPVTVSPVEWAALAEIDGTATVGQVAHRLGLGRHAAYTMVADLAARGLVEPAR